MVGIWWQMVAFAGFCFILLGLAASCLTVLGFFGFAWLFWLLWLLLDFAFVDGRIRSYTVDIGRLDFLQKHFRCASLA